VSDERLITAIADIVALDRRVTDGFASRDKALDVALTSLNAHLTVMNEFRGAMSDQAAEFITRKEHEQLLSQITEQALDARSIAAQYVPRVDMNAMTNRMENCEKQQATMQGRYAMVALLFSTGVVIANLVAVWWHQIMPS